MIYIIQSIEVTMRNRKCKVEDVDIKKLIVGKFLNFKMANSRNMISQV